MAKPRKYGDEYKKFHKSKKSKKARARRNTARRNSGLSKGSKMEVHHTKPNAKGSTRVVSRRTNRRIGRPGGKKK